MSLSGLQLCADFLTPSCGHTCASRDDEERHKKLLDSLNSGEMPPEDEQQPDSALKADFIEDLANVMVTARRSLADQRGVIKELIA